MSLRIYGAPRSRTFRVLWTAEELGVPYENEVVTAADGAKQPPFLALNPNGRIPAIADGEFVLWESHAINLYLAKKHGLGTLYPVSLENEARCWQWSLWAANELEKQLVDLVINRHILAPDKRDEKLAAAAEVQLARPLAVLDSYLETREHLLGGGFTIADLNVASVLYTAWFNKAELARGPHIKSWLDRMLTRPAALRARKLRED